MTNGRTETENKWHVFHLNENGMVTVNPMPKDGQRILWYHADQKDMEVFTWDEAGWNEYENPGDVVIFEVGDAWTELPEGPKFDIREALDEILKDYNRLDEGQYNALLNGFLSLRETAAKNTGKNNYAADNEAGDLEAVVDFMFLARMINSDQHEEMWELISKIRTENE